MPKFPFPFRPPPQPQPVMFEATSSAPQAHTVRPVDSADRIAERVRQSKEQIRAEERQIQEDAMVRSQVRNELEDEMNAKEEYESTFAVKPEDILGKEATFTDTDDGLDTSDNGLDDNEDDGTTISPEEAESIFGIDNEDIFGLEKPAPKRTHKVRPVKMNRQPPQMGLGGMRY